MTAVLLMHAAVLSLNSYTVRRHDISTALTFHKDGSR
jgi:hypothetical protein